MERVLGAREGAEKSQGLGAGEPSLWSCSSGGMVIPHLGTSRPFLLKGYNHCLEERWEEAGVSGVGEGLMIPGYLVHQWPPIPSPINPV